LKRIEQAEAECKRAENAWWITTFRAATTTAYTVPSKAPGAPRLVADFRQAGIWRAKLANVQADLPPDHGIAPSTDIAALIDQKIREHHELAAPAIGKIIKQYVKQELANQKQIYLDEIGDALGMVRAEFLE
jgi:hypothetical protein